MTKTDGDGHHPLRRIDQMRCIPIKLLLFGPLDKKKYAPRRHLHFSELAFEGMIEHECGRRIPVQIRGRGILLQSKANAQYAVADGKRVKANASRGDNGTVCVDDRMVSEQGQNEVE